MQVLRGRLKRPHDAVAWFQRLDELVAFLEQSGGSYPLNRAGRSKGEQRLGAWLQGERACDMHTRCMTAERVAWLEGLDGWSWEMSVPVQNEQNDTIWSERFDELAAFLERSGGGYPSKGSGRSKGEQRLASWLHYQREYKQEALCSLSHAAPGAAARRAGQTLGMRMARLEGLTGWRWEGPLRIAPGPGHEHQRPVFDGSVSGGEHSKAWTRVHKI